MACRQCSGIEAQFNDKVARRELKRYRRKGPRRTTRILLDFIRTADAHRGSLMDVGGGIGAIQHELAGSVSGPITSVDASPAYLAAAREEGQRLGYADQVTYISGDFLDVADETPSSDLVTMDRVVCCYPDVDAMLETAVAKSRRAVGLVFPRDDAYVRIGSRLTNWLLRLGKSDFRAFVHPHSQIEQTLKRGGFMPSNDTKGFLWRVALFTKSATNDGGAQLADA